MKTTLITLLLIVFLVAQAVPANALDTRRCKEIDVCSYSIPSIGIVPGQTLRYTWVHRDDRDQRIVAFEPSGLEVRLLDANGRIIAQANAAAVAAGAFQSFEFDRDQIGLPGEPGTGRLQVRLEVVVTGILWKTNRDLQEAVLATFDDEAEAIDKLTGRTTVSFKPKEIVVVGSKPIPPDEADLPSIPAAGGEEAILLDLGGPLGIAPRETLRVTAHLPHLTVAPDGREYKMLVAPLILDLDGNVVARRDEVTLEPGQFYSFDFKRAELPPGEPGTDRLQVRVEMQRRFRSFFIVDRTSLGMTSGSLELIDEGSGTTALLLPAVQAARESTRRR